MPVAVLGEEGFDVTWIEPTTIRLADVSPIRWSLVDAATPYEGPLEDAYDCHREKSDGYLDLGLKFDAKMLAKALGELKDGDVLVLELRGNLRPEFGGDEFAGKDIIRIIRKSSHFRYRR
jgi:hypothetical protein